MSAPAPLYDLRRSLTVTVHGDMGLVDGEVIAVGQQELRFWCREDLLVGTRHDLRVDLGPGAGNADLEVVIRKQEGLLRGRGFGHACTWSGHSADQRRRLLAVVQSQLPEAQFPAVSSASSDSETAPRERQPQRGAPETPGYAVMVAPGSTPTVAVTLSTSQALRVALRVRESRAVVRIGEQTDLEAGDRILLVLRLPDGTFQQHAASVAQSRAGMFARSDTLAPAARAHLARMLASAGVLR